VRCVRPLKAWQTPSGAVLFSAPSVGDRALDLPCGQCIECRLARSREWAVRCMHEASMYVPTEDDPYVGSWFVTLTYDDDHVPSDGNLQPEELQLYLKRVRKKFGSVRFFACGEYGDETSRPHYHLCMFGLRLRDLVYYRGSADARLYNSREFGSCWRFGFTVVGAVTFDSAAYVARYVTKKVTKDHAAARVSPLPNRVSEFGRMSLRPGIGESWLRKYVDDVYNYDHVVINGRECRPPRYYDRKLAEWNLPRLYTHKQARQLKAERSEDQNTPAQLAAREAIAVARLNLKKRSL
jgi:hypothetical protein